ncbi:hypothetical protein Tsubulata_035562 [Turnera subulata]|uniref:Uncharacterized protein n=1 Tax=Turnera subulata TaxID=218843 RepID=A0A9Q0FVJ1_9ROSI|nr:hypothetical protein Tsubulata_035562 [Turnera subulata]
MRHQQWRKVVSLLMRSYLVASEEEKAVSVAAPYSYNNLSVSWAQLSLFQRLVALITGELWFALVSFKVVAACIHRHHDCSHCSLIAVSRATTAPSSPSLEPPLLPHRRLPPLPHVEAGFGSSAMAMAALRREGRRIISSPVISPQPITAAAGLAMTSANGTEAPTRLEGKYKALVVCWLLGLGSLVSWNSMLTIGDYYYKLFPDYHPSRVLTLVYQPFVVGTMAILAHYEAKIDTRKRNILGYILFAASALMLVVSFFAGLAASGALTSALRLITKAALDKANDGLRKGASM